MVGANLVVYGGSLSGVGDDVQIRDPALGGHIERHHAVWSACIQQDGSNHSVDVGKLHAEGRDFPRDADQEADDAAGSEDGG